MKKRMSLTTAQQEYLKAIYFITRKYNVARIKQISEFLNVSNAAVSGTVRVLASSGYISYAPYETITLTRKGLLHARSNLHRQRALYEFFSTVLDMEPVHAYNSAKKMGASVDKELEERLLRFVYFYRKTVLQHGEKSEYNICSGKIVCDSCQSQLEKIS